MFCDTFEIFVVQNRATPHLATRIAPICNMFADLGRFIEAEFFHRWKIFGIHGI